MSIMSNWCARPRGRDARQASGTCPLMYQGGSDTFLSPSRPDPHGGRGTGASTARASGGDRRRRADGRGHRCLPRAIKLVMLVNDVSLRGLIPGETRQRASLFQSKPSSVLLAGRGERGGWLGEGLGRRQAASAAGKSTSTARLTVAPMPASTDVRFPQADPARRQDKGAVCGLDHRLGNRVQQGCRRAPPASRSAKAAGLLLALTRSAMIPRQSPRAHPRPPFMRSANTCAST